MRVILTSLRPRRPELGLLGAVTAGVGLAMLMISVTSGGIHVAVHGGLMFLLLHSLRWENPLEVAAPAPRPPGRWRSWPVSWCWLWARW